jgi:Fe-S oxidoreductase
MKFHPFVLPFTIGLGFVIIYVVAKWGIWIYRLPKDQKKKIYRNFFTLKPILASWEVFLESLVHRKIYRKNFLLGYLHMSLALGWFLLIVVGNLETRIFTPAAFNPPYLPIFFEYFNNSIPEALNYRKTFTIIMDFLLLFVVSGVALVFFKRIKSKALGMKRTTRHTIFDRIAMTTLWFIFPLRLFAEAISAAIFDKGDFLTGTVGKVLIHTSLPVVSLYMPLWWAYSVSLGVFFIALPFSRYMHIPTEILLIFLRKLGVKEKKHHTSFTDIEINSCPRCGICIDTCQLSSNLNINDTQPTYFFTSLRRNKPKDRITETCMLCMRCVSTCPVGIDITSIRNNKRKDKQNFKEFNLHNIDGSNVAPAKVAYFAGCMGHLTPSVIKATIKLFKEAGVDFSFIDVEGSICCGKPLLQVGEEKAAESLREKNRELFARSGAEIFVTSCPICAKEFSENYNLEIPVLHHSQYFLNLVNEGKLNVNDSGKQVAYHDPCELGRGLGVYNEPRELLSHAVTLVDAKQEKENSLCCGGSLGITNISAEQRKVIASNTLQELSQGVIKTIVTGCPLCKKTFQSVSDDYKVMDIAEILADNIEQKVEVICPQPELELAEF